MTDRDPRENPRPGDVIRKIVPNGRSKDRHVKDRIGGNIYYFTNPNWAHLSLEHRERCCWITTWRYWAKGTEIAAKGP